jgi:hypothetical protein
MSDAISKAIEAMDMARSAVGPFSLVVTKKLTESIEALQALQSGEPVVDELCKALSDIAEWTDRYTAPNHPISVIAKKALLSAGKGGGE